jgi:hypothetical protein
VDLGQESLLPADSSTSKSIPRQVHCRIEAATEKRELFRNGPAALLAGPKQFTKLLRRLHLRRWVVYAKAPFGGPLQVLRYLGRYTHRVANSNHRLLAFDGEEVSFRWRDYAHGSVQKMRTSGFAPQQASLRQLDRPPGKSAPKIPFQRWTPRAHLHRTRFQRAPIAAAGQALSFAKHRRAANERRLSLAPNPHREVKLSAW